MIFFHVRPFIKIDKPQDENESKRKIQLFTTKKQHNLKNNLEISVVKDMWQICIPIPKIMSNRSSK